MTDTLRRADSSTLNIAGPVGDYIENQKRQWLLIAPHANPAMLEMMRDRDNRPLREMVPWAGEFAGKYLTGAVEVMRLNGDPDLRAYLNDFVNRLLALQAEDGYLGPWPKQFRLTNSRPVPAQRGKRQPDAGNCWDTWGHYHVMMGLMHWHEETGSRPALAGAKRIADLLCKTYLGRRKTRLVDTGSVEMNLAPTHSLARLHRKTGTKSYLRLARQIIDEFAVKAPDGERAGEYLSGPLEGREFYELSRPRWESLHPIMGMIETWRATGEPELREAFERIWWSIVRHDRHNNGGFTSGEKATGSPYDRGAIESCCTIAWTAMSVEMLKLTGNPLVADELELTFLNSILGMHSPTGRWATYNTPMDGVCRASAHDIVFQSREGSPELNCCSVNTARGFGLVGEWALMAAEPGELLLNWYGPGEYKAEVKQGLQVTLRQDTDYPARKVVNLAVEPSRRARFALKLRIPRWSRRTQVTVNGEKISGVRRGTYLTLDRVWKRGDAVRISMDFTPHFWAGKNQCDGLTSVYRGPLLLAFDQRYNLHLLPNRDNDQRQRDRHTEANDKQEISKVLPAPEIDAGDLKLHKAKWRDWLEPLALFKCRAGNGKDVYLCDFASAGDTGSPYRSWLPIRATHPKGFPSWIHPCPGGPTRLSE